MTDSLIPDKSKGQHTSANSASASQNGSANQSDRRQRRRALISAPVRVRGVDVTQGGPDEITTTLDVSRKGILFASSSTSFVPGMEVAVTFPYTEAPLAMAAEREARVVRVSQVDGGGCAVALTFAVGAGEDLVDATGRRLAPKLDENAPGAPGPAEEDSERPLILVVDAEQCVGESLKAYLGAEGYKVIAVRRAAEAHEVLGLFTPALVIAEMEGEELPGLELCAHIKASPQLRNIPVMLLTRSAYPSDYASAHSLGAVVCMAKPYRQERLGHVVRLLAPTRQAKQNAAPLRPPDRTRQLARGKGPASRGTIRFRSDACWW